MTEIKDRIKDLAERNRKATTEEERAAVAAEMQSIRDENEKEFTEALESLIETTSKEAEELRMQNVSARLRTWFRWRT